MDYSFLLNGLGGSSGRNTTTFGVSNELLTNYYNAKSGLVNTGGDGSTSAVNVDPYAIKAAKASPTGTTQAPTAPWQTGSAAKKIDELVKSALAGSAFIREADIKLDLKGASEDYKKLYSMYQGVNTLVALSKKAQSTTISATDLANIRNRFAAGMNEVKSYVESADFDHLNLVAGTLSGSLKTNVGVASTNANYKGLSIHSGTATEAVEELSGDVKFSITAQKLGTATPVTVNLDLSEMGSQTRSLSNITSYVNTKLEAAGLSTRLQLNRTPAVPQTIKVGTKIITTGPGKDSFALGVKGDTTETISFAAPKSADSVYVVQTTGKETKTTTTKNGVSSSVVTNTFSKQLLKFQTDVSASGAPLPDAAVSPAGAQNWTANEAEQAAMEKTVSNVRASVGSSDGGVYVLADVKGTNDGQTIKGTQDVALIKYDSTGQIVFTRTLGASENASGYGLAVSSDGHVAVTGSVTGGFNATSGISATTSDSFVTLYDAVGNEQWSKRSDAASSDEALSVTFGAGNSVIIAGRTKSLMSGASTTQNAGYDSYIRGYSATGATQFTNQSGTAANDAANAMTVDGTTLYVASTQDGNAVINSYDISTPTPSLLATRNLGGLGGGSISAISVYGGNVYLGGSTGNGDLAAGAGVTRAYSGGQDGFALKLDAGLNASASDRVSFYGGTGNETAKVTFSSGKAYIAGQSDAEITGTTKISTKDAYLARLDVTSGAVEWSQRYTGKDGQVDPNAIAVTKDSSSVLDRLGLPTGALLYKDSTKLVANTSVRSGDQFFIRDAKSGAQQKITIDADETLDSLAAKINRASSFNVKVNVSKFNGNSSLTIAPSSKSSAIEIVRGPVGKDALTSLGISDGLVKDTVAALEAQKANPQKVKKDFGLGFDTSINLNSQEDMTRAMTTLDGVISKIRSAQTWLRLGSPDTSDPKKSSSGGVPAYLTKQISNYQDALFRLTGGG